MTQRHSRYRKLVPLSRPIWCLLLLQLCFIATANAQFWKQQEQEELLSGEDAFAAAVSVTPAGELLVDWSIADNYYMYRDQFAVEVVTPGVEVSEFVFPQGVVEDDPEFGSVEVYFFNAALRASIAGSGKADLIIKGQGCNKPVGVCYPPIARSISLDLPANLPPLVNGGDSGNVVDPQNANTLQAATLQNDGKQSAGGASSIVEKSFLGYVISAFFAGILLSFTPCVLPMIPILAGVIAGQEAISRWRSGWLAICYVAGTIVTYIFAGALAGATGAQLQAWFQNVWVIGAICLLLVILAMSLFGVFRIELPSSIQSRLNANGGNQRSASISSFTLGLISALVVGACVSPVLILALGAAITQGDPVLGAGIMGSMALGMGVLLIAFGFGAGWLLPRAGAWMQHVQVLFGLMVLGVAIYLLGAFPALPLLLMWAALLLCTGFYLWQLAGQATQPLANSMIKMVAAGLLIWGGMALIGGANKGDDILQPLASLSLSSGSSVAVQKLNFNKTTSLPEVQEQLKQAAAAAQPVMLDFYADWCLDCKRMHRTTFLEQTVFQALQGWRLIEVDVTKNSADSEAVKKYFKVFGPPATLFFSSNGEEHNSLRQYGYLNENQFLALIDRASAN